MPKKWKIWAPKTSTNIVNIEDFFVRDFARDIPKNTDTEKYRKNLKNAGPNLGRNISKNTGAGSRKIPTEIPSGPFSTLDVGNSIEIKGKIADDANDFEIALLHGVAADDPVDK